MKPVGTGTAFHSADIGLVVKNESSKKICKKKRETKKKTHTKKMNILVRRHRFNLHDKFDSIVMTYSI